MVTRINIAINVRNIDILVFNIKYMVAGGSVSEHSCVLYYRSPELRTMMV